MRATYQDMIQTHLAGRDYDPRHIEAFIRVEHGTLDQLDAARFKDEIELAIHCVDAAGKDAAERTAASLGL